MSGVSDGEWCRWRSPASEGTEKRAKIASVIWSEQLAEYRARFADFMRGAALGRYEQELRQQTAELNDLFLLLCFMEATALPNPATLYLLEIYPYLLEQFHATTPGSPRASPSSILASTCAVKIGARGSPI